MFFWTATLLGIGAFLGIWFLSDSLIPESSISIQSSKNRLLLGQEQREAVTTYALDSIECKSNLSNLFSGDKGPSYKINPIVPTRDSSEIKVLGSLEDTIVIESRLKGLDTQFYFRYQKEDVVTHPFIIFLHDINETPSTYLSGDSTMVEEFYASGYNLVAPYIYSDSNWISEINYQLSLSNQSLDWIVISKVQSLMDFLDYQYNSGFSNSYIIYGKGWGSIIGRGTASVDSRVKAVISEGFSSDPIREFLSGTFDNLIPYDLGLKGSECTSGSLQSFVDVIPIPHLLVKTSRFKEYADELALVINKEYEKVGKSGLFIVDSGDSLVNKVSEIVEN